MFLIGDTHSMRKVLHMIQDKGWTGQNLVHVGDFGLGFVSMEQDIKNLQAVDEALMDTDNHLYVIRGNHDNPIFWDRSKGVNLPKFHYLHLVDDYTIHKIEGKNVLFVGGAISIDRRPRMDDIPWPSWWKDEVFKYEPLKLDRLIAIHKTVDIVVTHTAPGFCYPQSADGVDIVEHYHAIEAAHGVDLKRELEEERASVTELYDDLTIHHKQTPSHWFYGHFHSSKKRLIKGIEFKLLNINETYEVN